MRGFERRKERSRESIRRAALELFSGYGFDKVSLSDIARRARVSQVTIYNHFGSKEQLVQEVIRTALTELIDSVRQIIRGDRPFLDIPMRK